MKNIQKLEFYSSVAAIFAAFFQLVFVFFFESHSKDDSIILLAIYGIAFVVFPVVVIFVGSYLHTVYENKIGLGLLLTFGSLFICLYGYIVLVGILAGVVMNKAAMINTVILLLPSFFVGCTMTFAVINALSASSKKNFS